ncbi:MAG: squalene/phytoene synthase family protein [Hyphomicrobiales bacterium]|nr:squalene/phytoene synthase family protein [Hyphomicrobiales bacterium]
MTVDAAAHCAAIVRAGNRDRYIADLLAPDERRADLFALHAFDVEVSTIRGKVSEPALGEIRIEWWRQALRGDHGGHPIGSALAETIARYRLPIAAFDNLLQARIFDLYDDAMPSLGDLEGYAGDVVSAVMQLGAIILAGGREPGTGEVAGFAGVAVAFTEILRNLSQTYGRGPRYLPADRLTAEGMDPTNPTLRKSEAAARVVAEELRQIAYARFAAAQKSADSLDRVVMPALLPAAVVPLLLKRIGRGDPLRRITDVSPFWRQWAIWRTARSGRL